MSDPRPDCPTYASLTDSVIDRPGGRYVTPAPTSAPATRLPAPQWCNDAALVPMEPPLGWDIGTLPDLGFPHEARLEREAKAKSEREAAHEPAPTQLRRI